MMFEKTGKETFIKLISVLLLASIAILAISVLTTQRDGRRQITDGDGGSEEQLCGILSAIDGAGQVDVMLEYDRQGQVSGVIVLAEGAGNAVVANNLTKGVATLYSIPVSSVIVFEKSYNENQS